MDIISESNVEGERIDSEAPQAAPGSAERGFSRSIFVSAVRCTLTYVVLPFIAPWIGLAESIGPGLGLGIGAIALTANVFSIRRFWRANHPWKRPVTVLHIGVIILLLVLAYYDITALVNG